MVDRRSISAPRGTGPVEDWPVDVQRTDKSGDGDLADIEYNPSLTPAERLEQHYQARLFVEALRAAGVRNGLAPSDSETAERESG